MTCREGRGAGGWVPPPIANGVYQTYLCHQASTKAQKDRVQRASKLVHTWRSGKSGHWRGTDTAPLPHTLPCVGSLPSGCCELEAFRIKWWSSNLTIFLSSGSCYSKLIKLEEWVVGTSGLRLLSQKQVTPWICNWHLKWEGGDSTVELIWYSLHADGVTIESNWKGPEDITKLHHVWKATSGVRVRQWSSKALTVEERVFPSQTNGLQSTQMAQHSGKSGSMWAEGSGVTSIQEGSFMEHWTWFQRQGFRIQRRSPSLGRTGQEHQILVSLTTKISTMRKHSAQPWKPQDQRTDLMAQERGMRVEISQTDTSPGLGAF